MTYVLLSIQAVFSQYLVITDYLGFRSMGVGVGSLKMEVETVPPTLDQHYEFMTRTAA